MKKFKGEKRGDVTISFFDLDGKHYGIKCNIKDCLNKKDDAKKLKQRLREQNLERIQCNLYKIMRYMIERIRYNHGMYDDEYMKYLDKHFEVVDKKVKR